MKRYYACPNCGSHEHLTARQSRTYDAYADVEITVGHDTGEPVIRETRVEDQDLETCVTTWYLCTSAECEDRKVWKPNQHRAAKTEFQLEDLVLYPRDIDLCKRCRHHFEDHRPKDDDEQERPCAECGCEDFEVPLVHPAQGVLEVGVPLAGAA